ncbi:hypothetical protein MASR1M90_20440 [Desulfovibrionales bacterium]
MIRDMLKPVENGLKVIANEIKWFFINAFKRRDICQMQKRLNEEYATLGRSVAQAHDNGVAFDPCASEHDLTLRQITFLRNELALLENDLSQTRADYLKKHNPDNGN